MRFLHIAIVSFHVEFLFWKVTPGNTSRLVWKSHHKMLTDVLSGRHTLISCSASNWHVFDSQHGVDKSWCVDSL